MFFTIIAVLILLSFYSCYFIKMINQRRRGITTDQLGKGKKGSKRIIEIMVKITTILTPVVEIVSIIFNTTMFPFYIRLIGIVICVFGVFFFITAVVQMRDSWRAGVSETEKTELVTEGLFKISRNPAFVGFDLVYIGILLMFFNWVLLVSSILSIVMFHLQIVCVEEGFLSQVFGESYLSYKKHVFRYLGAK